MNLEKNILPSNCDWCPLKCHTNRYIGNVGLCGANDKIYVANNSLHFWEEPTISGISGGPKRGFGPGSGTIFFSNCSMKCVYCQNFEISGIKSFKKGKIYTIDKLVCSMLDLQNQGAMNINFVTGTHYRNQIISAVRIAKNKGLTIPIIWNTSGYETVESIYALANTVDIWLTDFKYADNDLCNSYSINKIKDYVEVAVDAIEAMVELVGNFEFSTFNGNLQMIKGVIVRHLILPDNKDNTKNALKLLFNKFGNKVKYSIMNQYTPCINTKSISAKQFPSLLKKVAEDDYEYILDFADNLGIKDYYWQNGECATESFIPDFE